MASARQALIERFIDTARQFAKTVMAGKELCFKHFNLHPAQARVLTFVMHRQPVSIKDIAAAMGTTSSAATQIVESVVNSGYLRRMRGTHDRRKVEIVLSAKGTAKFTKFRKDHAARTRKVLRVLSNRELAALIAIQEKIIRHALQESRP